jgi:hypothetical protein
MPVAALDYHVAAREKLARKAVQRLDYAIARLYA